MPEPTLALPFVTVPIYSLALALGIAGTVGIALKRSVANIGTLVDICLATMIGSIIGGRIEHVLLNWMYFAPNLNEALRPSAGGLGWHGALLGGLLGLGLVALWRKLSFRSLLDMLSPALPLLAFTAWLGCWAAVCAYGAEVPTLADVPPFAAAETRDVYGIVAPRYNTQVFGMALAFTLLVLSIIMNRQGWLEGRRFWLLLALLSVGMFVIGFFRGDAVPMVAGLRVDQLLDIAIVVFSFWLLVFSKSDWI